MAATQLALRKVQIGRETTPGTSVAATAVLLNNRFDSSVAPAIHYPVQQRGLLVEQHPGIQVNQVVDHTWETEVSFEQILYALNMSMMALITGTGAGADKTWTFAPSPTGATDINTFTLEKRYTDGTTNFDFEYPHTFARQLRISGRQNAVPSMAVDLSSANEVSAAITAALTAPAVWQVPAVNMGKVFVDSTWAGLGTTVLAAQVFGFDWTYITGYERRYYLNNQLGFSRRRRGKRSTRLALQMDYHTQAQAFRDAVLSRAAFAIRVQLLGTAVGGGVHTINLDGWYVLDPTGAITTSEEEDTITIPLMARYDPTGAQDVRVTVINSLGTLT